MSRLLYPNLHISVQVSVYGWLQQLIIKNLFVLEVLYLIEMLALELRTVVFINT